MPQVRAANAVGALITKLQDARVALGEVIDRADAMHDEGEAQAQLLTTEGADRMAEVRALCDELEITVGDDQWPLPKYREMLFPV